MSTRALFKLASIMLVVGCGADSARDLADNDSRVEPPGLTFADDASPEAKVSPDGGAHSDSDVPDTAVPACGPGNCSGCCDADGDCLEGNGDTFCGSLGSPCADCTLVDSHCESGHCRSCAPKCSNKICGQSDGCGGACSNGSGCCTPKCSDKICGESNGCGGTCNNGSGCCTPKCSDKICGESDGCGGTCNNGSGCCTPKCWNKLCGQSNGCSGTCKKGSGCCTPKCSDKICGESDECSGTCKKGSGCCTPKCSDKICGHSDGCGGTCETGSGCCVSTTETLDGKDNDCDGHIDDGYWANVKGTTFTTLATYDPACTKATDFSQACNNAAQLYCAAQGYVGGFGPVYLTPADSTTVVCLADATYLTVNVSTLTAQHAGCGVSNTFSSNCAVAIHKYCKARSYVSGVGPVKHSGYDSTADIICVKHAHSVSASQQSLKAKNSWCTEADFFSLACRSAIMRTCAAYSSFVAGFGHFYQGTSAWLNCLPERP